MSGTSVSNLATQRSSKTADHNLQRIAKACHRCKRKKIRCFHVGREQKVCAPCARARAECVFDSPSDGLPRGAEYVAELESRIATLEHELGKQQSSPFGSHQSGHTAPTPDGLLPQWIQAPSLTVGNLLGTKSNDTPLELPSEHNASQLMEAAYMHIQSRYCIVDWIQIRFWHLQRKEVCRGPSPHKGAFFLWMMWAIGAQLVSKSEHPPEAYYSQALAHADAVLGALDTTSLQGLLVLTQYHFRGPEPRIQWHFAEMAMRLAVELGYHRSLAKTRGEDILDPYVYELRKRLFWSAYCMDRAVCISSKRPFGLHEGDLDAETPVNIDVTCDDGESIRKAHISSEGDDLAITSMTAALHHIRIYRLKSQILTSFTGPSAVSPPRETIIAYLNELAQWRQRVPRLQEAFAVPLQSEGKIQSMYFSTALLLIRPTLVRTAVDDNLLLRYATLMAEACENEKLTSLDPSTHNSRLTIHSCFQCGIALLQCLAVQPNIIPLAQAVRALTSCSSALAVYARTLATARPFLQLFEKLCDLFLADPFSSAVGGPVCLRNALRKVTSRGITEVPELLESNLGDVPTPSLREPQELEPTATQAEGTNMYDFLMDPDFIPSLDVNFQATNSLFFANAMPSDSGGLWNGPA